MNNVFNKKKHELIEYYTSVRFSYLSFRYHNFNAVEASLGYFINLDMNECAHKFHSVMETYDINYADVLTKADD